MFFSRLNRKCQSISFTGCSLINNGIVFWGHIITIIVFMFFLGGCSNPIDLSPSFYELNYIPPDDIVKPSDIDTNSISLMCLTFTDARRSELVGRSSRLMSILGPTINELYIKNEDLRLTFTIAVSNTLRGIGYNVVRNSERHTEEQIPDNETEDFQYLIGGKITKFSLNTKWTSVSDNADASVEYYIYIQKINSNDESHWFGPFNVKNKVSSAGAISPEKAARKSYVAVIDECMYTLVNNLSDIFNKE